MTNISRRRLLVVGGLSSATVLGARTPAGGTENQIVLPRIPKLPSGLFKLGVASGDPLPDSVVLWTRLAPDPIRGGGMPNRTVPVQWEIASDEQFRQRVQAGTASALPELGHSVHVETRGLRPDAWYFYRFRVGTEISPVGRTRTAPASGAATSRLRFAVASCQNYQHGYYVAHRDLARQNLDFVAFLGDYIYESGPSSTAVRRHEGTGEPFTLAEYRNRYARYRTDADLRAAHAAFPWIVTLDDHEVDNDWAAAVPQDPDKQSPSAFAARRAAAFQAWYEHMPVRQSTRPNVTRMQVYRRFEWGTLARIHVLDTRQYRTDQATTPAQADDPARTMTGAAQERWLTGGLTTGSQRWNIIANQTPVAQTDEVAGPEQVLWMDPWDGYRVQRRRLMELMGTSQVANPLVVTGDRHWTMACDLKPDFNRAGSPVVASELVATSITSNGDEDQAAWHRRWDPVIRESPHWKYGDGRRGYLLCDVDRTRTLATQRVVNTVVSNAGVASQGEQFVVQAGRKGIQLA
jgi:alkaline phosphatase D